MLENEKILGSIPRMGTMNFSFFAIITPVLSSFLFTLRLPSSHSLFASFLQQHLLNECRMKILEAK